MNVSRTRQPAWRPPAAASEVRLCARRAWQRRAEVEAKVEMLVDHTTIRAVIGPGTGTGIPIRVLVGGEEAVAEFSYAAPSIMETSLVPFEGGWFDITGLNFGAKRRNIIVSIGEVRTERIKIVTAHTKLRCWIPPSLTSYADMRQMRGGDEEELLTDVLTVNVAGLIGKATVRYAPPKPPVEFAEGADMGGHRIGMRTPSPFGWGTSSEASSLSMASTGDVATEPENQHASSNGVAAQKKKKVRWTPDEEASDCELCHTKFNFFVRKHHCRSCGKLVCGNCSNREQYVAAYGRRVRVCTYCNKRIESIKEELHSLKAELRHLAVMRSTELGKKIQLESELHLMRLQMPPPSQKALKEAEALVVKQERKADAKNERFQHIQARIEELHQLAEVSEETAK